ncbi:MAG: pyridoxal-phosphate dependent enzyme [Planctomycetaceae bacterium]|nr:pyridoxal-phosphate dependent enzyme [Planctomycetaceae bacterium]
MSIWRFADLIAPVPAEARVSLGEGSTPLIRSRRIGPAAGLNNLYFKLETSNPAGSYKDRFACVAISDMCARRKTRVIATSSGNAGAALAAYSAAAGIECHIAVAETAPDSKLRQMLAYGAQIFRIRGFGLDPDLSERAFDQLRRIASRADSALHISAYTFSPVGMTGVQTIGYELAEQLPELDQVYAPAGSGGLCIALARAYAQLLDRGLLAKRPAIEVVQPVGNDTIATPLATGAERARNVVVETKISGLQVPNVIDGHQALAECRATGGSGHAVPDELIWETQRQLARDEGVFAEPAGAAALAAVLQAASRGQLRPDARIACVVTGTGFKDESAVARMIGDATAPMIEISDLEHME